MIEARTCYVLRCDACGEPLEIDGWRPHYDGPDDPSLKDWLEDGDWTTNGTRHHCDRCPVLLEGEPWSYQRARESAR